MQTNVRKHCLAGAATFEDHDHVSAVVRNQVPLIETAKVQVAVAGGDKLSATAQWKRVAKPVIVHDDRFQSTPSLGVPVSANGAVSAVSVHSPSAV